jgi:hypothetical protein
MISLLSKAVFPWAAGGMVLIVLGGYAKHTYDENIRLEMEIKTQQDIITEQANYAMMLSDVLETRDLQVSALEQNMKELHNEWSDYRETVEDSCINNPHPNIYKWLPNGQPNSYFDGDTPPRIPATGI